MSKREVRDVGLSGIAVLPDRMRALRQEVVDEIAESMAGPQGQLQPIVIRPTESIGYYLVAGRHRLEAARHLKWDSIWATIVDGLDADTAVLAEIDENLIRGELSPAERAAHIGKRKSLYEKLHPETKHGAVGKSRQIGDSKRFTAETAAKIGQSERKIQRDATRAHKIPNVGDLAGTSLDQGEELDALAKLSPEKQKPLIERAKAGEKVKVSAAVKQENRDRRLADLAEATKQAAEKLGEKLFTVIYADPPWKFEVRSENGMDRSADNHYPPMTLDEIKSTKVPAAKDAVLFLWATAPMTPQALEVMTAWGFTYKSQCVWVKDKLGTGFWFRNQHEILLVGTRGHVPAPVQGQQYSSVIKAAVGAHSAKPECFAEIIEDMFPGVPSIELFARRERLGWTVWGNEVPSQPILVAAE